ncbi:MAG: hypothetical protein OXH09_03410 [Gammaproteobacteria bacterium]|nr:hypothetical protein [Gammaproteobacteria bacterium]
MSGCASTQRVWIENDDFVQTQVGPDKSQVLSTAQSILQCRKEWRDRTSRQPTLDTIVAYTGLVTNEKGLSFFAGLVWMMRALFSPDDRADYIRLCMEAAGFTVQCVLASEEAMLKRSLKCECVDPQLEKALCPGYLDDVRSASPDWVQGYGTDDRAGRRPESSK